MRKHLPLDGYVSEFSKISYTHKPPLKCITKDECDVLYTRHALNPQTVYKLAQ